jgi:hypothetical protein
MKIEITPKDEMAMADGMGLAMKVVLIPLMATLGLNQLCSHYNKPSNLDSILQGKEFVMKDVNCDGKLDMISKKGIYLHTKDWKYKKIKNLGKYLTNL